MDNYPNHSDQVNSEQVNDSKQDARDQNPKFEFDDASFESLKRFAQIASVPLLAGFRAAAGALAGTMNGDRDVRRDDNQLRNAETLFTVLGTLRGGAAKLGQALSVFEPAVPQQLIGPYREALT